jgi:hypothetical protein
MGEIRVKAKLTNAIDDMMARGGQMPREAVRTYLADAVVDTGAVRTIIPNHVLETLGIGERGQRVAEDADGRTDTVPLSGPVVIELLGRDCLEDALVLGDEVLIGQTVLEKLDLWADCRGQQIHPNPAHPDQPVNKVR